MLLAGPYTGWQQRIQVQLAHKDDEVLTGLRISYQKHQLGCRKVAVDGRNPASVGRWFIPL